MFEVSRENLFFTVILLCCNKNVVYPGNNDHQGLLIGSLHSAECVLVILAWLLILAMKVREDFCWIDHWIFTTYFVPSCDTTLVKTRRQERIQNPSIELRDVKWKWEVKVK